MILGCGGTKEEQHYEKEGKLYGISPFAHCDTDCPYTEGTYKLLSGMVFGSTLNANTD